MTNFDLYRFALENVTLPFHEEKPGIEGYDRWYFNLLDNTYATITWEGRNWNLQITLLDWEGEVFLSETFASCEELLEAFNKQLAPGQSICFA
jgi:hypothetical protein